MEQLRQMYLDLMRRTILGFTFRDPSWQHKGVFNHQARMDGEDWPVLAHSMVGDARLRNVQELLEKVIEDNIPGDFIETGVWRGGTCIFAAAVLKAWNITDRNVWVCDSFQGLPRPKPFEYPVDSNDTHFMVQFLAVSQEEVTQNFIGYNLLSDQIKFVKGWFSDTLPKIPTDTKLAILRLDGDMYESTIVALENLYSKLSLGGYVIVDDFGLENCRKALSDFRNFHNITDDYIKIDNSSVYWTKTKELDSDKINYRFKKSS
jgi:O-methyltransferase